MALEREKKKLLGENPQPSCHVYFPACQNKKLKMNSTTVGVKPTTFRSEVEPTNPLGYAVIAC